MLICAGRDDGCGAHAGVAGELLIGAASQENDRNRSNVLHHVPAPGRKYPSPSLIPGLPEFAACRRGNLTVSYIETSPLVRCIIY